MGRALAKPVFRGWQLQELVESIGERLNCLLIGPTGTGKSLCVFEAVERLPRPRRLFIIEGHSSLKEFDLLGGYVPDGDGGFQWRDGVVTQALREDGSEEVLASDDFCVVMASNLGKGYHVESYDAALISRFPVVLEFRYLPPREEEQLLRERTGIGRQEAHVMVKVANETRRLKRSHELSGCIDLRGLIAWATKFNTRKEEDLLARLRASARITVMYSVCGADSEGYIREDTQEVLLSLVEAHTPK